MDKDTREKLDELVLDWQKQLVEAADSSRREESPQYERDYQQGMVGAYYSVIEAINGKFGTNYVSFSVGRYRGPIMASLEKELREYIKTPKNPLCKESKKRVFTVSTKPDPVQKKP